MAGSSLLVLLDDIAAVLDDVSLMTKMAAKKTAGVLGDDLAVNAEKVTGVRAEREIPVVWAVAKGSFKNKLILVPAALVLSVIAPWLISPVLIIGGLYLCYEGFEKIVHHMLHGKEEDAEHDELVGHLKEEEDFDIVAFEQNKITGAIRTDFILSLEIIVLTLGIVSESPLMTKVLVLSGIAMLMTVGVYGLVAGIVKLDDAGLHLMQKEGEGVWRASQRWIGARLLSFAPWLMKALGVVGTIAMFLVGGGILVHGFHFIDVAIKQVTELAGALAGVGPFLAAITPTLGSLVVGLIAGAIVVGAVVTFQRLRGVIE
jgi:predicted DNA repair protein MutK